jgi:hypothetical protein
MCIFYFILCNYITIHGAKNIKSEKLLGTFLRTLL